MNKNHIYAPVSSGYGIPGRGGQRVFETLWNEVIDRGTDYRSHISDLGPCWTSRASIQTCLYSRNHLVRANTVADYHGHYVTGLYEDVYGNGYRTAGPWGTTRAGTLPAQRVPITNPDHASLLRTDAGNIDPTLRFLDDDAQARTGSFYHELARENVKVMVCGKWNNQWTNSEPLPSGVEFAHFTPNTASGSQWSMNLLTYEGDNPWDGDGIGGDNAAGGVPKIDYTTLNYSRGTATSVSWSSANGGELVVSGVSAGHLFVDPSTLTYTQYAGLKTNSTTLAGFTGYAWPVSRVISSTSFAVTCTSNPNGTTTGSAQATVYNREQYQAIYMARQIASFLEDRYTAGEPAFVYFAPHIPHNTGIPPSNYGQSFEKMYEDAVPVPAGNGLWFDGVETDVSPTSTDPPTSDQLTAWTDVMQMLATADDALAIIIEKLSSLYGDDWTMIVTGDNGNQVGEQATRNNAGVKTAIWQGSASPFLYIKGPRFAQGAKQMRVSSHADIGVTVLDIFGLEDNHMHDDRDGVSLLRVFDSTHAAYNRLVPVYGDWKATTGEGYVRNLADWSATHAATAPTCAKFVRNSQAAPTVCKAYDIRLPSDGGDYETDEVDINTATTPTLATFNSKFNAIDAARWNEQTNTNTCNDGSITA